ncbi:hypothetical protein ELH26_02595 [Rhizobium leguminosarum]|nr:hypothetical protein ELH26_02595 [Rhizobium leguminosarum]
MMPALTSGDYCHGHLASVTGALRGRMFTHRLPRSGLVYWRKIIAGRALIAARIYRGFWTNGNGFLRGMYSDRPRFLRCPHLPPISRELAWTYHL